MWIDLHGNSMRVDAWKIRSRRTVAIGLWEQDLVESFVGVTGASFLFSPPAPPRSLPSSIFYSPPFSPILCSSLPILSLLARHSVIQLRLTLTPSEAKNDHAPLIFLPLPPDGWDHSHKPQHPAYVTLGISARPRLYMLSTLPTEPKHQS